MKFDKIVNRQYLLTASANIMMQTAFVEPATSSHGVLQVRTLLPGVSFSVVSAYVVEHNSTVILVTRIDSESQQKNTNPTVFFRT